MTQNWIWQNENWPNFDINSTSVLPHAMNATRAVAPLIKLASELSLEKRAEFEGQVILDETISTSIIEKEVLDRDSVRSSISRHLGLPISKHGDRRYKSFTHVFFDSIRNASTPLTNKQIKAWHESLFIERPVLRTVTIGEYRDDEMSIVSGHFGRNESIHYQAPCSNRKCVKEQMNSFLAWLNDGDNTDYIRAAIAKFWFVSIHPFDDGNGRLSRIIAERCLAQADQTDIHLYSISTEIEKHKSEYYDLLENTQKGNGDITNWVIWFINRIEDAAIASQKRLDKVLLSTRFWDQHRLTNFNERQRKLIVRLLDTNDFEDGIARRKYKNLVNTSDATAARDLLSLVEMGVLSTSGKGRSVKYFLQTTE